MPVVGILPERIVVMASDTKADVYISSPGTAIIPMSTVYAGVDKRKTWPRSIQKVLRDRKWVLGHFIKDVGLGAFEELQLRCWYAKGGDQSAYRQRGA